MSDKNYLLALRLIASSSVTPLAELLDKADATIAALVFERDDACAETERLRIPARALELLKGEGWAVADYVAQAEEEARAAKGEK